MSDPERSLEENAILESWKASQLSSVWKPESITYNRFLVSIDYPKYSTNLLGYIELEHLIKGSGGLIIPIRLSKTHTLSPIAATNVEALYKMKPDMPSVPVSIAEIIKKQQLSSYDLVHMYQNVGFPINHDDEKGFCPEPVNGFTLNFRTSPTGEISLWIYQFRSSEANEISFQDSSDPNNSVWRESAQEFSTVINDGLPFIVHPMSIQGLNLKIKASD